MTTSVNRTRIISHSSKAQKSAFSAFICVLFILSACRGAGTADDAGPLEVSGVIEGEQVTIASQVGGTVAEILVQEGDAVGAGDLLLRLDDATLQAQLAEAQTQVRTARASRDLVAAGPRAGEIAAARAVVAGAEAARQGALQTWHHAIDARDNPQELDGRITAARAELEVATFQVELARLALQAADLERNASQEGSDARRAKEAQVRAASAELAAVEAARDGAQARLNQLYAIRGRPLVAQARIRAAAGQYAIAAADVRLAEARLAELQAGPGESELAVAEALVRQAQAAAGVLAAQARLMAIRAPAVMAFGAPADGAPLQEGDSAVSARIVHEGEAVSPGAPLLTLTRRDPLYLTLYVPTERVGQVKLGQPVQVGVDSFPGEVFPGRIVYISPRAEFSPHSLQTAQERVRAVFAIRVRLPNADGRLKPGMPADAVIKGVTKDE
jgi:HlyD family secretion protein